MRIAVFSLETEKIVVYQDFRSDSNDLKHGFLSGKELVETIRNVNRSFVRAFAEDGGDKDVSRSRFRSKDQAVRSGISAATDSKQANGSSAPAAPPPVLHVRHWQIGTEQVFLLEISQLSAVGDLVLALVVPVRWTAETGRDVTKSIRDALVQRARAQARPAAPRAQAPLPPPITAADVAAVLPSLALRHIRMLAAAAQQKMAGSNPCWMYFVYVPAFMGDYHGHAYVTPAADVGESTSFEETGSGLIDPALKPRGPSALQTSTTGVPVPSKDPMSVGGGTGSGTPPRSKITPVLATRTSASTAATPHRPSPLGYPSATGAAGALNKKASGGGGMAGLLGRNRQSSKGSSSSWFKGVSAGRTSGSQKTVPVVHKASTTDSDPSVVQPELPPRSTFARGLASLTSAGKGKSPAPSTSGAGSRDEPLPFSSVAAGPSSGLQRQASSVKASSFIGGLFGKSSGLKSSVEPLERWHGGDPPPLGMGGTSQAHPPSGGNDMLAVINPEALGDESPDSAKGVSHSSPQASPNGLISTASVGTKEGNAGHLGAGRRSLRASLSDGLDKSAPAAPSGPPVKGGEALALSGTSASPPHPSSGIASSRVMPSGPIPSTADRQISKQTTPSPKGGSKIPSSPSGLFSIFSHMKRSPSASATHPSGLPDPTDVVVPFGATEEGSQNPKTPSASRAASAPPRSRPSEASTAGSFMRLPMTGGHLSKPTGGTSMEKRSSGGGGGGGFFSGSFSFGKHKTTEQPLGEASERVRGANDFWWPSAEDSLSGGGQRPLAEAASPTRPTFDTRSVSTAPAPVAGGPFPSPSAFVTKSNRIGPLQHLMIFRDNSETSTSPPPTGEAMVASSSESEPMLGAPSGSVRWDPSSIATAVLQVRPLEEVGVLDLDKPDLAYPELEDVELEIEMEAQVFGRSADAGQPAAGASGVGQPPLPQPKVMRKVRQTFAVVGVRYEMVMAVTAIPCAAGESDSLHIGRVSKMRYFLTDVLVPMSSLMHLLACHYTERELQAAAGQLTALLE